MWRGLTTVASIAALGFALLWLVPRPAQPPLIVVLSATSAATGGAAAAAGATLTTFVASISGDGRALVTRPLTTVGLPSDHSLELWAVPPSGAPRSLGLISAAGATVLKNAAAVSGASALAVSLEPSGGSPTGAPTGPILYSGKLTL